MMIVHTPRLQESAEMAASSENQRQREHECGEDDMNPIVLRQVLEDIASLTKQFGPHSEKLAQAWNSLGLIRMHMQHNVVEAEQCHTEALNIYRLNRSCAIRIAETLSDLGDCREKRKDATQAMAFYEEARTALREANTPESHHLMQSLSRKIARLNRS